MENFKEFEVSFEKSSFNFSAYSNELNYSSLSIDLRFLLPIYISCPDCKKNFKLKLVSFEYMNIECGCKLLKNCTLIEFINKFCSSKPNEFRCKLHDKDKSIQKYTKYCQDCKKDLCETCLELKSKYNNDSGKHTAHETHELIDLLNINQEIDETKNLIETKFEKNE